MVEFPDFNHRPMETPTTNTSMSVIELLQKQDDGDFLRAAAEVVLQLLMKHGVEAIGRTAGRSPVPVSPSERAS